MKGALPGTELRIGFSGFKTTGMESHFNTGPILLFLMREPKVIYFAVLYNTTLKDIILQIINSVK